MRVVEVMHEHREFFLIAALVLLFVAATLLFLGLVSDFQIHCTHCS